MPKRKADSVLEGDSRKCPRSVASGRSNQVEFILANGFVPSTKCEWCLSSGEECIMDRTRRYSKCAGCTRRGHPCRREFHTDNEWDLLRRAEQKVADDISAADDELDLLEPELKQLQERLAEVQSKIRGTLARHARLRKQQKFLKERGFKMSEHDSELLAILDEKKSSPEQASSSSALDLQQLAATAENPDFDRILLEIDQMPAAFWDVPDVSLLGGVSGGSPSPVGGTVEPAGGSPSGSR